MSDFCHDIKVGDFVSLYSFELGTIDGTVVNVDSKKIVVQVPGGMKFHVSFSRIFLLEKRL